MSMLNRKIFTYYLFAILFSWTLFFITDAWLIPEYGHTGFVKLIALYGHMLAMFGPMLAVFFTLKFFHRRNPLSFKFGDKKYYLYFFIAWMLLWLLPGLMWLAFDKHLMLKVFYNNYDFIFIFSYLIFGWFAGTAEEYGWSAYILTELSGKIGKSKAIVISGILRGLWHLPLFVIPVLLKVFNGEKTFVDLFIFTIIFAIQLIVSNIFFSALFGYVWYKTESIPMLGWMHFVFDAFRDLTIFFIIGFSGSFWFKFGWGIPFYFLAFLAFTKIVREEGYSNYLEIFYKKKHTN